MAFLPALRMSGIFDRSSQGGRPFGQPDTGDDMDLGSLMRLVGPTAESLKNDDLRRQKDLMQFEHSLRTPKKGFAAPASNNLIQGKKNVVLGPQGGFGALQSRFQRQEDIEDQQGFQSGERALDRSSMLDLSKLRESGEMERIGRDLAGRKELAHLVGDINLGLERERARTATETAALAHTRMMERNAAEARARGEQDRLTNAARPLTGTAATHKDQNEAIVGKINELGIRNPALAEMIIQDPNTGRLSLRGGTPADHEQIRNFLFGSQQAQPQRSTAQPSNQVRPIQRRDRKSGMVQESSDGGKTWRTISPGSDGRNQYPGGKR